MKANLTDYISSFAAFSPDFDVLSKDNSLTKAQNCYKGTKLFLDLLDQHVTSFPALKIIRAQIADLNELFADTLLVQTNGLIKLNNESNLSVAKSRVQFSHALAKSLLSTQHEFIESIQDFSKEINDLVERAQQSTLDEKKKLDAVDHTLLANSQISYGLQDRFFGGAVNINTKTSRSNTSLFANSDFNDLSSPLGEVKGQPELLNIIATLQNFVKRAVAVNNTFGFIQEDLINVPGLGFNS